MIEQACSRKRTPGQSGLVLSAIGVVFGDIGTSPLYTFRESLKAAGGVSPLTVFGITSLILWSIVVVVTLKYVFYVMRAHNEGEGGILALTALATRAAAPRWQPALFAIGVFGAAMFYGDSMITPAISVLSAVEGMTLVAPQLERWIIPVALIVLTCLFKAQKGGTGSVGALFGPVMVIWFIVLALLGLHQIALHPEILRAVAPSYAARFIAHAPGTSFVVLGCVFLALTGAEALYADMGHFGGGVIRRAWLVLVMPSLALNYFGQAALVLSRPTASSQPFFESAPSWALGPLVVLATAATIIASQAVISGAFSMTKQAVQLGFLPRMTIVHTSRHEIGQIYVPFINLVLFVAVLLLVVAFRSSDNLAAAYGIAVASTMVLTTVLMFHVTRNIWNWGVKSYCVVGGLLLLDVAFVASNATKILEGGWLPLAVGGAAFTVMMTWNRGQRLLVERTKDESVSLAPFIRHLCEGVDAPPRVAGTAVFSSSLPHVAPRSLLHNLKHNRVLHQFNLFVAWENETVPYVPANERLQVSDLGHGCHLLLAKQGFMESSTIESVLESAERAIRGWCYEPEDVSFFFARDSVVVKTEGHVFARCHERLFQFLMKNTSRTADHAGAPNNRVVELGAHVVL